jgi:Resolvase, N terminal domain/Recombinase
VIARLDRLSRNVGLITSLMDSGLEFVATDFPHANRFTIHILAAVAEYESNLNSERMKVVLAAAKARGVKLGVQRAKVAHAFPEGSRAASNRVRQARARERARDLAPIVWGLIAEGKSYREIAHELNSRKIPSPNRRGWYANAIFRIVQSTANEFGTSPEAKSARSLGPHVMKAMQRNREVGPLLLKFRADDMSFAAMAAELDKREIRPPRGGQWGQVSIWRYLKRAMNVSALRAPRKPSP